MFSVQILHVFLNLSQYVSFFYIIVGYIVFLILNFSCSLVVYRITLDFFFYNDLDSQVRLLQARLQQYVNHELPHIQPGFRNDREIRDQIANIHWMIEKVRVPERHLLLLY